MLCTDCHFATGHWETMKEHYKEEHPEVKNPSRFFTKEAKKK